MNTGRKNEIWKDIPNFEGLYQASNEGRIRSVKRIIAHSRFGTIKRRGKLMRVQPDGRGYLRIELYKNGKSYEFRKYRLIAVTFVPNPLSKSTVNHINGIKTDDRAANLEWVTISENIKHAHITGLHKNKKWKDNKFTKSLMAKETIKIESGAEELTTIKNQ